MVVLETVVQGKPEMPITRIGWQTLMIGAGLAGVYTFLYITLRQQDYALLMGAIALFIVLAIVMYVTRKVDWYARDVS